MKATLNRSGPPSVANPSQAETTPHAGAERAPVPRFVPTPVDLKQAEELFEKIANLASQAERACCFFPLIDTCPDADEVERVEHELERRRDALRRDRIDRGPW